MSQQAKDVGWSAAAIGAVLAGCIGAIIGVLMAAWYWDAAFWKLLVVGGLVGALPSMLVAGGLAFHGAAVGSLHELPQASRWGAVTGLVVGLSLTPLVGLVIGWGLQAPGLGGGVGVVMGLIAGVVGWQTGFWLAHMTTS